MNEGTTQTDRLVTIADAAHQLNITAAAVRDWRLKRKFLAFVKVGSAVRVKQSSINQFIERQTLPALESAN